MRERFIGGAGSFRRNALVLTIGTLAAQGLPLILYPVFTRLYRPEDFGVFATVSLLSTVAAVVASGAYEHVILIARSRKTAAHIAAYALFRSAIVLGAAFLLSFPVSEVALRMDMDAGVVVWWPAVPWIAALLVIYNSYSEWCVRHQYFGELSRIRIWQTSAIAAGRLLLGVAAPSINGFVAGDIVGKATAAVRCAFRFRVQDGPYLRIHSLARMRVAARRHSHVARYILPDQIINILGGSLHVLFFSAAFGTAELGYITLVLSVLYVPITVVSAAVKDVFRQRASTEFSSVGTCRPTYRRLLLPLGIVALAGFGAVYVVSPVLFPLVLGTGWEVAGEYARILTPLFFFNFVSMSLGGVFVIAERASMSLLWQVLGLALTLAALIVGTLVLREVVAALWLFSLTRAGVYALHMIMSYHVAEGPSARSVPTRSA